MDDLVVIVLTLLLAGVGLIGQLKKKKQASGSEGEQKKQKDIWDLLGEGVFPQEQEVESTTVPVEQEEVETYVNKQNYHFHAKNKEKKTIEKKIKPTKTTKKIDGKIKEEFTLRKAVIYSEILNRKYK